MFIVYYRNNLDNGKIIRPTPYISISYSLDKNKNSLTEADHPMRPIIGGRYSITLNGTLLVNGGSPNDNDTSDLTSILSVSPNYENNPNGDFTRTNKQIINFSDRAYSMFLKQQALRALFAHDGQKMEILSIRNDEPVFIFYPELESISFEEGTYTDFCRYTINLTAPVLFDKNNNILDSANTFYNGGEQQNRHYHVENYTDSWSLEPDDSLAITPNTIAPGAAISNIIPKVHRITRNISATGKTMYFPGDIREEAWEQAKKFVKFNILKENIGSASSEQIRNFPSYGDTLGSGLLNIPLPITAYNHIRSENINKTDGTYSLTDSWIIAPSGNDNAIESYSSSVSSDNSSPLVSISINGNIKGLSPANADNFANANKLNNAMSKLNALSNNLTFDLNSTIFKRARNHTPIVLNIIPNSLNITQNPSTGEVSYNVTYNNRPTNFINNVSSENIVITDTYPGDIFSVIPVINSTTGPLLQYIGGRTEYRRDLNIDLVVNRSNIGYYTMNQKGSYIYKKPSINPAISSSLSSLITMCSPANEPTIRKYFLNPPSENWDPKTGKYSLQISWTYELNT